MKEMNLGAASEGSKLDTIRFPGWYKDTDGGVCIVYKEHLVAIRYDEAAQQYHITADVLGKRGLFDKNVFWETAFNITNAKQFALDVVSKLAAGVPLT